jgi:DNA repair exonuclease SbcCD ATPase subunit
LESRRNEAEQRLELARARRDAALTRSRIAQLRTELESWAAHKGEVREAEDALARMPLIDEARIAVLEQLEDQVRSVQSRIEGTAARVQLLAGGAPMTLEGRPLEPDGLELVAKPAVLRHPDGTCVRLLPGGMDLATLTNKLGDLESERRRLLLESGVESASQARRLHATRASQEALLAQLRRQAGQRKDPGPELGPMQARLDALEQRSLAMEQAGVRSAPGDDPEMVESEVATIKEGTKRVDEELVALRDEARAHSEEAGRRREARARVEADKDRAEGALMQLSRQLGEDGGRRSTIDDLERRAEELQGLQREAQGKSDSLAALRKRRALTLDLLEKQRSLRDKAVGEIEALERDLLGDVAQDHGAQIEDKRAQRTRLKARADSARERAEADLLLKELFDEVRKDARDARLAPFAKACSEYLAIAYGASVTIGFDDTKGATTTGSIDRRAAGLDANSFGVLSHGAREFTSLAVRLALAEVLASEQADRCLPVVLDDAAANIDPERFRQVGFLLAFAASRGLQVVFATCNVDEASRLQADAVVPLRRPRLVSSDGLARAEDRHADLEAEDREAPDTASRGSVSPDRSSSVGAATDAGDMESALKALRDAGGTASSRAWRAALEWDEDRFNAARELLSRRGAIEQLPGTRTWQLRGNQPHA